MASFTRFTCVITSLLALQCAALTCAVSPDGDESITTTPAAPKETVTLAEPGAEPRTALRYRLTVGATQTFRLDSQTKVTQRLGDQPLPSMEVPRVLMTCTLAVERIDDDGTIHTTFTLGECGILKPRSTREFERTLPELNGVAGTLVLTDRGLVVSSAVTDGAEDTPELAAYLQTLDQSLRQLLMPLPEEPVGQGGVWRVARTVTPNGTVVQERLKVTLKRTGERFELETEVTQSADSQDIRAPRPDAPSMRLTRHDASGTILGRYSLAQLILDPGVLRMKTSSEMELEISGSRQRMHTEVNVTTMIKPGAIPR